MVAIGSCCPCPRCPRHLMRSLFKYIHCISRQPSHRAHVVASYDWLRVGFCWKSVGYRSTWNIFEYHWIWFVSFHACQWVSRTVCSDLFWCCSGFLLYYEYLPIWMRRQSQSREGHVASRQGLHDRQHMLKSHQSMPAYPPWKVAKVFQMLDLDSAAKFLGAQEGCSGLCAKRCRPMRWTTVGWTTEARTLLSKSIALFWRQLKVLKILLSGRRCLKVAEMVELILMGSCGCY